MFQELRPDYPRLVQGKQRRTDNLYYVTYLGGRLRVHKTRYCCPEVKGMIGDVHIWGPIQTLELADKRAEGLGYPVEDCPKSIRR